MKYNILHITPDFNYACGRSYYVYLLLKYLNKKHNVFLLTNGGDSFDRLEKQGIPYIVLKGCKSKNPLYAAKCIKKIREFVKENKIHIIHSHHRYFEFLGLQALKKRGKNRPKTVFTSLSIVNRKYNIEYRSDRIIAVSKTVNDMLTGKFGINPKKISLIPNFTDTEEIHELEIIQSRMREHGRLYTILAIGRFHHEKNFETLLNALKFLNDARIELILIGEGDNDIDYKKIISRYNLNVEIIVPQKNLIQYFLIADLCVLPSVRDPFPNFMLQAGLHKKPFIGADVDGIAELISGGINGLLFKSGNEAELADLILQFKNNRIFAKQCAENLHKDVLNNYTQEFIIPKIESLYRELIKQPV